MSLLEKIKFSILKNDLVTDSIDKSDLNIIKGLDSYIIYCPPIPEVEDFDLEEMKTYHLLFKLIYDKDIELKVYKYLGRYGTIVGDTYLINLASLMRMRIENVDYIIKDFLLKICPLDLKGDLLDDNISPDDMNRIIYNIISCYSNTNCNRIILDIDSFIYVPEVDILKVRENVIDYSLFPITFDIIDYSLLELTELQNLSRDFYISIDEYKAGQSKYRNEILSGNFEGNYFTLNLYQALYAVINMSKSISGDNLAANSILPVGISNKCKITIDLLSIIIYLGKSGNSNLKTDILNALYANKVISEDDIISGKYNPKINEDDVQRISDEEIDEIISEEDIT